MSEAVEGTLQQDRVALITGASRGIGRGIALALAHRGWAIAAAFRTSIEAAAELNRQVKQANGTCLTVQADVASDRDRERLVAETLARFGRIDLLVNNAGMAPRQRVDLLEVAEASYDEVMAVNLKGPFFLAQRVAHVMIAQVKAGNSRVDRLHIFRPRIVNIGSISAYTSSTNRGEYCLSKAGLAMMTALFADRLAEYGIGVYEIRPGIIQTDMTGPAKERYDRLIVEGLTPIRRWGTPEDVAAAVVAIATDSLPFSTGEVINVDGGFHIRRL